MVPWSPRGHDESSDVMWPSCTGELLHNGICLPKIWPPAGTFTTASATPPYLTSPPDVIDISLGRQLFVDVFLIDEMDRYLRLDYSRPTYSRHNPVLSATEPWEVVGGSDSYGGFASPFSGGVWFDPQAAEYRMFYRCGDHQCLATSLDAISWRKPSLPVVAGTNIIQQDKLDSSTVWLDLDAANGEPSAGDSRPEHPYKMASTCNFRASCTALTFFTSADGIHFEADVNHRRSETGCGCPSQPFDLWILCLCL